MNLEELLSDYGDILEFDQQVKPRPKGERKPKQGQCYSTANWIVDGTNGKVIQGVKAILLDSGQWFPFQHAWNRINGECFDWYLERTNKRPTRYFSQIELSDQERCRYMCALQCHGNYVWLAQAEAAGKLTIEDGKIIWESERETCPS